MREYGLPEVRATPSKGKGKADKISGIGERHDQMKGQIRKIIRTNGNCGKVLWYMYDRGKVKTSAILEVFLTVYTFKLS